MRELVLASRSPRRRRLLESCGWSVKVAPVSVEEHRTEGEGPAVYAQRLAKEKLWAALAEHPTLAASQLPWIAADTIVCPLGAGAEVVFEKPSSAAEAESMLRTLTSGPPHDVLTAWALWWGEALELALESTRVWFRPLERAELDAYLTHGGWQDKAGGYGIQDVATAWVTRIEGSYTNVVGLPLAQVVARLQRREADR